MAAQKVQFGLTTALKRREVRILHLWSIPIEVVWQNWTREVICLFQKDWEVGRVASSLPFVNGCVKEELRGRAVTTKRKIGVCGELF